MLFGRKKERETEELIRRHIQQVSVVVDDLYKETIDYCADCVEVEALATKVSAGESKADEIRREIEHQLYDGAFMPVQRGDYSNMVESVDKIANQCEDVAQFLFLTRPELGDQTKEGLVKIIESTVRCYKHITEMFVNFEDGLAVVEMAHKVEEEEQNVDKLFAEYISSLFSSDLDLALKIHIKMLYDRAAAISNRIEDASDRFCVVVSKRP